MQHSKGAEELIKRTRARSFPARLWGGLLTALGLGGAAATAIAQHRFGLISVMFLTASLMTAATTLLWDVRLLLYIRYLGDIRDHLEQGEQQLRSLRGKLAQTDEPGLGRATEYTDLDLNYRINVLAMYESYPWRKPMAKNRDRW